MCSYILTHESAPAVKIHFRYILLPIPLSPRRSSMPQSADRWLVETSKRIEWLLIDAKSCPEKRRGIGMLLMAMEMVVASHPTSVQGLALAVVKEIALG